MEYIEKLKAPKKKQGLFSSISDANDSKEDVENFKKLQSHK